MQIALPNDPNHCPLCGQTNECAMEVERATGVKQPPCWCSQVKFEAALLSRILSTLVSTFSDASAATPSRAKGKSQGVRMQDWAY